VVCLAESHKNFCTSPAEKCKQMCVQVCRGNVWWLVCQHQMQPPQRLLTLLGPTIKLASPAGPLINGWLSGSGGPSLLGHDD
jgi:hypothetical protein